MNKKLGPPFFHQEAQKNTGPNKEIPPVCPLTGAMQLYHVFAYTRRNDPWRSDVHELIPSKLPSLIVFFFPFLLSSTFIITQLEGDEAEEQIYSRRSYHYSCGLHACGIVDPNIPTYSSARAVSRVCTAYTRINRPTANCDVCCLWWSRTWRRPCPDEIHSALPFNTEMYAVHLPCKVMAVSGSHGNARMLLVSSRTQLDMSRSFFDVNRDEGQWNMHILEF
jgi:hypothetical protein